MIFFKNLFKRKQKNGCPKKANVFSKKVDGSWKVIKPKDEYVFMFNNEGGYIWELIEAEKYSMDEIAVNYEKKYKIGLNRSKKMVDKFISECRDNKLIK